MAIIYQTEQPYTGPFINVHAMDPVKQWAKHYSNHKYLKFIHDNTKDGFEKRQANKELQIAQKKMDYWYKMAKFQIDEVTKVKKEIDDKWSVS